jgi:hypothetical protein
VSESGAKSVELITSNISLAITAAFLLKKALKASLGFSGESNRTALVELIQRFE